MPYAVRNFLKNNNYVASATGLTALDQTAAAFTWGAWVRAPAAGANSYLWHHSDGGSASGPVPARNGISIYMNTRGSVALNVWDSSSASVQTPDGFLQPGVWTHIGARYDGAIGVWYRNGRAVYSAAMTKAPTTSAPHGSRVTALGVVAGAVSGGVYADLWDIRVFPAVTLSPGDMSGLCDPTQQFPGEKQRLFYHRFTRAAGTGAITIFDESGNSNHLTSSSTLLECSTIDAPDWRRVLRPPHIVGKAPAAPSLAPVVRILQTFV